MYVTVIFGFCAAVVLSAELTTQYRDVDCGKVACAGCHQPGAAFADGRSLGHSVSLAAGWTVRRSPSLLSQ